MAEPSADGTLVDRVAAVLRAKEWAVEPDEDPGALHLSPSDGEAPWPVLVLVGPDDEQVTVYSLWPEDLPDNRIGEVMALITEANLDRTIGSFELDQEDGDLRFRTSLDLARADVDDDQLAALVGNLVHHNLTAMDEWWDLIQEVVGGTDARTVIG